ncbi:uncharacterized protein LOC117506240 isoform X2 [Thalassophryne amazonica]|uniref:uncharacterized protein LOC117506240 isoform X2 n=1 Tax=Thalassophryne amazonica TaxID=390379 RepID=UPI00147105BA|nr:uncharacterized protein LOC117506240 isoform X2 [Thalassophryne amazonica]
MILSPVTMETGVTVPDHAGSNAADEPGNALKTAHEAKPTRRQPRRRAVAAVGRRIQKGKRRNPTEKRSGQKVKKRGKKEKRQGQEENEEGVTVKRTWSDSKRRYDKRHYCVFCRRPQVKIARHLLRQHADEEEVAMASALPMGSKQRHLLLDQLRCRGNYLHNIEVIRHGSGEIIPCRRPSEEVDSGNYLPCPLCLGFFLRPVLWKHQAFCRKKLTSDPAVDGTTRLPKDMTSDPAEIMTCHPVSDRKSESTEDTLTVDHTETQVTQITGLSPDQTTTSDPRMDQPRKRFRVQAAASRLLPISGGASESCSEILHRMNQDHISQQVKSDWLICKYGNKLMENKDGSPKRYDYVSQKLRDLGRFVLAARSLDSDVQNLHDILAPGKLSLALAAARKASGYRWSRPPLVVKTTLMTVCDLAIAENVQEGDWEAAAKTTEFFNLLGQDWDTLGLMIPDTALAVGGTQVKKRSVKPGNEKKDTIQGPEQPGPRPQSEDSLKVGSRPENSTLPESRLQSPVSAPRKFHRRPWSPAEKQAVWRQLEVHVLAQSVPGKEACQRCLDLEPVLRGRHWKDIKNQVYNQIQSQKKQLFHAQMNLQENQEEQQPIQNQKKQQCHAQMDPQNKDHAHTQRKRQCEAQVDQPGTDNIQNQKKQQYQIPMDHPDDMQSQKKHQYQVQMNHQGIQTQNINTRPPLDHQDQIQIHKKQLYQLDSQIQRLQTGLERDTGILTAPYSSEGPHRVLGQTVLDRDPTMGPYPLSHRAPGLHMDQLLSRTAWTDESLVQTAQSVSTWPGIHSRMHHQEDLRPIPTLDMSTSDGHAHF